MTWFVSRQMYYFSGKKVVEITEGKFPTNLLKNRFDGESKEYVNPLEAAEIAIQIKNAWNKMGGNCAGIAIGHRSDLYSEIATEFAVLESDELVLAWGKEAKEKLPKCDYCSSILGDKSIKNEIIPNEVFCSIQCFLKRANQLFGENDGLETNSVG